MKDTTPYLGHYDYILSELKDATGDYREKLLVSLHVLYLKEALDAMDAHPSRQFWYGSAA